jgi:S1-C subfamily serine protease
MVRMGMGTMVCTATAMSCAAVAVSGCGGGSPSSAAPRATAQERMNFAVVGVEARIGDDDALGSGFVIDGQRGLVVTAAHTVWGARSLKLSTALGVLHGRIVARAPCDDLAVLELYPRIPGLAALPTAPVGSAGSQLLRSLGRRHTEARTEAAALASIPVRTTAKIPISSGGIPLPVTGVPLDSPLVPEISGGPVVDQVGRLVGMAQAMNAPRVDGPAVAVPWAEIRLRLDQLQPGPRSVYVGWANQYRCVGRQDAYARAMHRGYRLSDARFNVPIAPTRLPGTEGMDG